MQENPGYATRTRKRRPQLSESEDGDPVLGRRSGMTLSRQDSAGTGDGLGARNTLPHSGHRGHRHRPGADTSVARSMSVPPKILHHTLTKPDNKVNLSNEHVSLDLKEKCEILKNIWINCIYPNITFVESEVTFFPLLCKLLFTKLLLTTILVLFILRN